MKRRLSALAGLAVLCAGGCDARYGVRGWVVPADDRPSLITCSDMPPRPREVIADARVELWRPGRQGPVASDSTGVFEGEFSVGEIVPGHGGPLTYELKAAAPGRRPFIGEIVLRSSGAEYVIIGLPRRRAGRP